MTMTQTITDKDMKKIKVVQSPPLISTTNRLT